MPSFDTIISELGYGHRYWSCSTAKKGYAGTALFSKLKPLCVSYGLSAAGSHNEEGRTISAEYDNFHLVNSYVPNSGQKLERLRWRHETWDKEMLAHLKYLESGESTTTSKDNEASSSSSSGGGTLNSFFKECKDDTSSSSGPSAKPVIFTGDLNVAHQEIDLKNHKTNANKTAGFCDEEREGMTNFLAAGFDDTYRRLYPEGEEYTYWGMRTNGYASNTGWRIDYFITSEVLRPRIHSMKVRAEVYGASDHCPILLNLEK